MCCDLCDSLDYCDSYGTLKHGSPDHFAYSVMRKLLWKITFSIHLKAVLREYNCENRYLCTNGIYHEAAMSLQGIKPKLLADWPRTRFGAWLWSLKTEPNGRLDNEILILVISEYRGFISVGRCFLNINIVVGDVGQPILQSYACIQRTCHEVGNTAN